MPRACLCLFAAAESLGFGCVRGVPLHFYLESLGWEVLSRMGLSAASAECRADIYVRVPSSSRVFPRRDRSRWFYSKFLAPLEGSEIKRGGRRDVTALVRVQRPRHLELLLQNPWDGMIAPALDYPTPDVTSRWISL
jgi:hypothetical protein